MVYQIKSVGDGFFINIWGHLMHFIFDRFNLFLFFLTKVILKSKANYSTIVEIRSSHFFPGKNKATIQRELNGIQVSSVTIAFSG